MNSASLCRLAGRYDNPVPPWFLAPIDCLKIPTLQHNDMFVSVFVLCHEVCCKVQWTTKIGEHTINSKATQTMRSLEIDCLHSGPKLQAIFVMIILKSTYCTESTIFCIKVQDT